MAPWFQSGMHDLKMGIQDAFPQLGPLWRWCLHHQVLSRGDGVLTPSPSRPSLGKTEVWNETRDVQSEEPSPLGHRRCTTSPVKTSCETPLALHQKVIPAGNGANPSCTVITWYWVYVEAPKRDLSCL